MMFFKTGPQPRSYTMAGELGLTAIIFIGTLAPLINISNPHHNFIYVMSSPHPVKY